MSRDRSPAAKPDVFVAVRLPPELRQLPDAPYTLHFGDARPPDLPPAVRQRVRALITNGAHGASRELLDCFPRLELIAVNFARFSDGRGYSLARLLRGRYGYRGELRAVGDVLLDQLFYLMRVGFDAYALRDDQDPLAAGAALRTFSASYQAGADQPLPLFRQRRAAA